ncbi:MAG: hypothetical protein ABI655_11805, partial [Phenylobacterium sp.]
TAKSLTVDASTAATIKTLAVGAALSVSSTPSIGAGVGSVAVNTVDTATEAGISTVSVAASNNVGVIATDEDVVQVIAGAVAASLNSAAVGLSVVVNDMGGDVTASITNASVAALAQDPTQTLTVGTGELATPIDTTTITAPTTTAPNLTRATKTVTGVAVNAASAQAVTAISFSAAVSATSAGAGAADVVTNILEGTTTASVAGSSINQLAGANARQQLDVNASSHTYAGTFVLGAAGSGSNAGSAAIGVNKFGRTTVASITNSNAGALGAVTVGSVASQNVAAIAMGLGVGGGVGVAATGIINLLDGDTEAYVTGGTLTAQSLAVSAQSITEVSDLGGSVSLGGNAAVGATIDASISSNTTLAYVGSAATTTGVTLAGGPLEVTAQTTSDFHDLGISGALAGTVAVAGMVSYNQVNNTTRAGLYTLNAGVTGGDVDVTAGETLSLNQKLGGGAVGGTAGVGAAVVDDIIQSSVTAEIVGSQIGTTGAVNVAATSDKDVTAFSATGAAGLAVGLDAGVGVILIGSGDTGGASGQLTGGSNGGTAGQVNTLTSTGAVQVFTDKTVVDQARLNAATTAGTAGLDSAQPDLTVASISGGTITAGAVDVAATNTTSLKNTTGAGAAGTVGVGVGVG